DGTPPIMPALQGKVHWGHLLAEVRAGHPWTVAIAAEHVDGSPAMPSMALAAYAAMQPELASPTTQPSSPRITLDTLRNRLYLNDAKGQPADEVAFTKTDVITSENLKSGQRRDD